MSPEGAVLGEDASPKKWRSDGAPRRRLPPVLKRERRSLLYVGRLHGVDNLCVEESLLKRLAIQVKLSHVQPHQLSAPCSLGTLAIQVVAPYRIEMWVLPRPLTAMLDHCGSESGGRGPLLVNDGANEEKGCRPKDEGEEVCHFPTTIMRH